MPILETKRLILRQLCQGDMNDIYDLVYADPEIKNMWSGREGTPEEIKKSFAEEYIAPENAFGLKGVALKNTGDLIGLMGFQTHDPGEGESIWYLLSVEEPHRRVGYDPDYIEAELTYALGKTYWKQGYATEMGMAMVQWGFDTLGLGRIIQGVLGHNDNSINLMKRLGFRIEKGLKGNVIGVLADYEAWQEKFGSEG